MAKHIIVVGGGASGLTAAIQAAGRGARVTVLEHMDRVGKKILSTGNGKCNMTNRNLTKDCYRSDNPGFPMDTIRHFSVEDTLAFFEGLGILPREKNGYIYPNSEQASSVLDALRMEAEHLGVEMVCGCHVKAVRPGRAFEVSCVQIQEGSKRPVHFTCEA
ncbi:NAD(P)/FAD-dependent oxidoreductase [Clostridium sp. AM58-1XD]|uniref:NAD(P)/FAD-dependent oxidoreductase n=1 Tax=Clostridium sp. AM58-1XD TaxID=2292307 RepID=UPI00241E3FD8|nr:NAD(P)/FAD-dependent oxidoreductase [Clostridium sp. AM58-1XD]